MTHGPSRRLSVVARVVYTLTRSVGPRYECEGSAARTARCPGHAAASACASMNEARRRTARETHPVAAGRAALLAIALRGSSRQPRPPRRRTRRARRAERGPPARPEPAPPWTRSMPAPASVRAGGTPYTHRRADRDPGDRTAPPRPGGSASYSPRCCARPPATGCRSPTERRPGRHPTAAQRGGVGRPNVGRGGLPADGRPRGAVIITARRPGRALPRRADAAPAAARRRSSATAAAGPVEGRRRHDHRHPRYAYRGAMLDVVPALLHRRRGQAVHRPARPVQDQQLHLHLSDDQGWRIAIDSWPRLATTAAAPRSAAARAATTPRREYTEIVALRGARATSPSCPRSTCRATPTPPSPPTPS